jgi:hypothetical protein
MAGKLLNVDPKPASDFLRDILKQAGTGKSRRIYVDALEQILGVELAPHFQILSCRKGRLVVELNSAPLFAEIRLSSRRDPNSHQRTCPR